ncbi:MAG: hypothetical protein BWY76_01439 [bacterium ADurb.Bin429]|nr:MAG: hypothetical protein BWY76_01439 [bacterium ADurb.Bin429]
MSRWDPCTPHFLVSTMRTMVGLWIIVSATAAGWFASAFGGALAGGLVAIAAFYIALHAGKTVTPDARFARVMAVLQLKQLALWVAIALLIMVVKVEPAGFAVGVSILPVGILLTLGWYLLPRGKTQP